MVAASIGRPESRSLDHVPITPTHSTLYPPLASPEVYRFTINEYERMAGVLDDARVELINGYLVEKCPRDRRTSGP